MTETIFSKIIRKEIPARIVYETESVLAFHDVAPKAPVHVLIIPKTFVENVADAKPEHRELLGDLLLAAGEVARQLGVDQTGYRLVINNGATAGQSVFHLHVHLMAGRDFKWPPG